MNKINSWVNPNYIMVLIIVIAAILRFYHIDFQSVWLDEICSINEANPNIKWSDLEETILVSDPHPPLYFALLKIMFQLFGYTTFVARIFSAIIGILGVYSFYLLGKEICNKKVGQLAAFLLAINYFHIYYSQEVRMYALLLLFTVLSYYKLIIFLKTNTYKNATWYGVFTGLMLLTQFFGLFVLASQLFILFIYFLKSPKEKKLSFIYKSLVSGLVIVVFFIPALTIFIETTKKKYTSIQPTTLDTIFQIFKDFVQNSYYLLSCGIILIMLYFFIIIKEKLFKKSEESFVLLILFSWIGITLLLPIIRSYLVTPMIISRYFITILPPIILIIALGIIKINSNLVRMLCILVFTVISLYELFFFNDYYNKIAKTQFREVTEYINKENIENDQVVSNLEWYLIYFFQNQNTPIVGRVFENHVEDMINDTTKIKSFWYFGAFGNPLNLSEKSSNFIEENFVVVHSLNKFDSWTKHYVHKTKENLEFYNIPLNHITLSNIVDDNWIGGVSTRNNLLLVDFSQKNEEKLKHAKSLKTKNGNFFKIIKSEKAGNFIHLHIDKKVFADKDWLKYPTTIEIINND